MNRGIRYDINEPEENRQARENAAAKLVGRKVNLNMTEQDITIGEKTKTYKRYKLDDNNFEQEVDSISSNNRIFPPGTMGTMDYQASRLNVYINEEGIVTQVSYG